MTVGFIGLGIMGRPRAEKLVKAGYSLTVLDKFANSEDLALDTAHDLGVPIPLSANSMETLQALKMTEWAPKTIAQSFGTTRSSQMSKSEDRNEL